MQQYKEYQNYLELKGIPNAITEIAYPFVEKQFDAWGLNSTRDTFTRSATFDFGKHEFGEIVDLEQCVDTIKIQIISNIIDYDKLGKPLHQKRLQQLLENPFKGLQYSICKGYYLYVFTPEIVDSESTIIPLREHWIDYYNREFATIWQQRDQILRKRILKKLAS